MKSLLFITFLTFLKTSGFASAQSFEDKFFEQKLDHFSNNSGTWKQHYIENAEFYKPGGPIFLILDGPYYAPISSNDLRKGALVEYVKQQGGHLVALEARFYGLSQPTSDLSTENLKKYHTFSQSAQDKVEFVKWLKSRAEFPNAKVIAYGVALVGSKMVHAMRENPGLIDIGIASATMVELHHEMPEFIGDAVNKLKQLDPECYESIHDGLICMAEIARGGSCQGHNASDVRRLLNLCEDVDSPLSDLDLGGIESEVVQEIGILMAFDNPSPNAPYSISKMCQALATPGESHLDKFAAELKKIFKFPCIESRFEKSVKRLSDPSWEGLGSKHGQFGQRQTIFLRCNEGALIKTADKLDLGPKGNKLPEEHFYALCKNLFNISAEEVKTNTKTANDLYGSRRLPPQCTIFVSGSEELVHHSGMSVQSQDEAGSCNRYIRIEGGSISLERSEIPPEGKSYPPGLRTSQLQLGSWIDDWLKTGNCCVPDAKQSIQFEPTIFDVFG